MTNKELIEALRRFRDCGDRLGDAVLVPLGRWKKVAKSEEEFQKVIDFVLQDYDTLPFGTIEGELGCIALPDRAFERLIRGRPKKLCSKSVARSI